MIYEFTKVKSLNSRLEMLRKSEMNDFHIGLTYTNRYDIYHSFSTYLAFGTLEKYLEKKKNKTHTHRKKGDEMTISRCFNIVYST